MYQVSMFNAVSEAGLSLFPESYQRTQSMEEADVLLVRSASLHETVFPDNVKAVARAGAGVNNIPLKTCAEKGIVVFNTPGANANGVKELVIAGLLLASRDIIGGIEWVKAHAGEEQIAGGGGEGEKSDLRDRRLKVRSLASSVWEPSGRW